MRVIRTDSTRRDLHDTLDEIVGGALERAIRTDLT